MAGDVKVRVKSSILGNGDVVAMVALHSSVVAVDIGVAALAPILVAALLVFRSDGPTHALQDARGALRTACPALPMLHTQTALEHQGVVATRRIDEKQEW